MLKEKLNEMMKPILKEVYAEGYNAGQEDTSRRMYSMYVWGYENGAVDAYAKLRLEVTALRVCRDEERLAAREQRRVRLREDHRLLYI